MVYTVKEYVGQYADRDLMNRSALEKTGFQVDGRLCSKRDMATLDRIASAHMLLPRLAVECPDLYDDSPCNEKAIRRACVAAADEVARLAGPEGYAPCRSDVDLMVAYIKAIRRTGLNWARMNDDGFIFLRSAIYGAIQDVPVNAVDSVCSNVIKRLPSLAVDPDPENEVIRNAVAAVRKDLARKKNETKGGGL